MGCKLHIVEITSYIETQSQTKILDIATKQKSAQLVSDHFDQIGSGTPFNERTWVAGGF